MNCLDNKFSHLTNTSINKHSPSLSWTKEDIGPGCKWTLQKLREYFDATGRDFKRIWKRIEGIIILSLLPVSQQISVHSEGCFELYGFDILIDETAKTWLLEINLSPALSVDSPIDILVKQVLFTLNLAIIG